MADYNQLIECRECDYCGKDHNDIVLHLKSHHIPAKKYFESRFPKHDIYSQDVIQYKSFEQYYLTSFINKRNMKAWLAKDNRKARAWIASRLDAYCEIKNLSFVPSQSELKTILTLPTIEIIESVFSQPFHRVCEELELKSKYIYEHIYPVPYYELESIIVDTREQAPFKYKGVETISTKLECGDYAESVDSTLVIERKGSGDFCSTLCGGLERFKREIGRAQKLGIYMVVVVESTANKIQYIKRNFGKASGDFIMHNMRQLGRDFDNIQFVFCDGKKEASGRAFKILSLRNGVANIDLEYEFDKGNI